ncbi:bifunctional helix-turn-helix transcriptional regulator/GNAT family N-acetyltransferase [Hydrogenophaga laconesensis]|uniref:DNA-binding MarR family transcriptional regulator/GNAT superfamily N-acetyltransferase n=1 Tax=Hydrogenophaga laconesensis TaxID=1805971 RepID=A0ABU1V4N7_9BURK|nr:helix-turn-helix domain-containing GNAT family N-acetyltransferase [Hydrogenophaga laconesensis]MDR7092426.1 DNA-binding MarR family transcriptional regulator/GNAT superfamily N-acetyltransferase [Hydrogenophaga laconesensis]
MTDAMPGTAPVDPAQVRAMRAFNRLYTQRSGLLDPYLGSAFSLTEVRVLYELAHHAPCTASELGRRLLLDAGYVSRIVRRFTEAGWITRTPSPTDARQHALSLTAEGRAAFEPMQQRSREEAARLLAPLAPDQRHTLVTALARVQSLLDPTATSQRTAVLRDVRAGDMGWVVEQHGEIYGLEYGWNSEFEALVAEIVAGMIRRHDPAWERGWIAELDGERVGSVFVVRKSDTEAQLRLLILTPAARGLGLGARLTEECIAFARAKGYRKMVLWTNSNLDVARAIYARRGFELVHSEPYHGYGQDLVGETWELAL